eukprot:8859524-Prorocentrum_lima.AAC.1
MYPERFPPQESWGRREFARPRGSLAWLISALDYERRHNIPWASTTRSIDLRRWKVTKTRS